MTVTQEASKPGRLARIIALILTPAVLVGAAIAVAFSIWTYSIGVRVGERSIAFDKATAARIAAERADLDADKQRISDQLNEANRKLAEEQERNKKLTASDRIYDLRTNETVQIAGFPTVIGMVGTAPAGIATINFENTKRDVKAGDKFTTHTGSVEACQVAVVAVETRSMKLTAQCVDPPQN